MMHWAIWILWGLPYYYIVSLGYISDSGVSLVGISPWVGLLGLIYGLVWGVVHRKVALGWFAISPFLSHVMFTNALFFSDQLNSHETTWLISAFWLVQFAILTFLVFRLKGMRLAAAGLAVFGGAYAYHAGFFSAMAFTGAWL